MNKFVYLLLLLVLPLISFSQYRYEISTEDLNGSTAKSAYSEICKNIEFTNRKVIDNRLIFESKNKYTQEKIKNIVRLAGYELSLFRVSAIETESSSQKK